MTEPIDLIAEELGKSRAEAQNFVFEIRKIIGVPISYSEILNAFKKLREHGQQAKTPSTVVALLRSPQKLTPPQSSQEDQKKKKNPIKKRKENQKNYFVQYTPEVFKQKEEAIQKVESLISEQRIIIIQIATILGVEERTAITFAAQVFKEANKKFDFGSTVNFVAVLNVLKVIENPKEAAPKIVADILFSLQKFPPQKSIPKLRPKPTQKPKLTTPSHQEIQHQKRQIAQPISSFSKLSDQFEIANRQSIQTLFTEFQICLDLDQAKIQAKDKSVYLLNSSLLNNLDRGQIYLQSLVDRMTARKEFNTLEQLIVMLFVSDCVSQTKLEWEIITKILNAIAVNMVRNNWLLTSILRQIIIQVRQRKQINNFVYQALFSLYYRANLFKEKQYVAHFDDLSRLCFKVLPSQDLATFFRFTTHSIWTLVWQLSSASLPLLLPDIGRGETWASQTDIPNAFQILSRENIPAFDAEELLSYSRSCYSDIQEKRRYQVPSQGRAEILSSDRLKNLIGLNLVRFVQEDIEASGVLLRFEFGLHQPAIGLVRVNQDGTTEGFHEIARFSDSFRAIIETIALAYYRDLVTPGKVYHYEPGSGKPRIKPSLSSIYRELPRPQNIPLHTKNNPRLKGRLLHHLHAWHEARERARHLVVGHIRWIGEGFIADPEKQLQALEHLGKKLAPGYTFVIEHKRGGLGSSGLKLSPEGYLTERTLFLPPERTSTELDKLLP